MGFRLKDLLILNQLTRDIVIKLGRGIKFLGKGGITLADQSHFTQEIAKHVQSHLTKHYFQNYPVDLEFYVGTYYVYVSLEKGFRFAVRYDSNAGWFSVVWKQNKDGSTSKKFGRHQLILMDRNVNPSDTEQLIFGLTAAILLYINNDIFTEIFDQQEIDRIRQFASSQLKEMNSAKEAKLAKSELQSLKQKEMQRLAIEKERAERSAKEKSNNQKLWWGIAFFVFWLVVFVLSPGDGCYSTYDGEMVCN
jgi:hypothetical protein